ncbi:MAG TPA: hypothetical protein VK125_01990 [Bacillota bacterium]|nr:hypothetical protein [Bacillota bacterium]
MKLVKLLFVGFVAAFLVACADNVEEAKEEMAGESEALEEEVDALEKEIDELKKEVEELGKEEQEAVDEEASEDVSEGTLVETYEEGKIIAEQIDVDQLSMQINTDNPNSRVLFFHTDDYSEKYKTVFVKKEKRLKIIDERKDDLIYNEIIK